MPGKPPALRKCQGHPVICRNFSFAYQSNDKHSFLFCRAKKQNLSSADSSLHLSQNYACHFLCVDAKKVTPACPQIISIASRAGKKNQERTLPDGEAGIYSPFLSFA